MRSTGKDETGAGPDGFGFFDKIEERKNKFLVRWEDQLFRVSIEVIAVILLIELIVAVVIALIKWAV